MPHSLHDFLVPATLVAAAMAGCSSEAPTLHAAVRQPHEAGADCGSCHAAQRDAWEGSDHARALGDSDQALARFDGVPVVLPGLTATPTLLAGEPWFLIEDGSGSQQLPVAMVVGHDPLQQVLLQGRRGELLVAPVAWDVQGERWFDPSVDGVASDPADPLYWGGLAGTFDHQCAGCHATGVVKRFDPVQDRYDTSWDEPHVACSACHGDPAEGLADMSDRAAVQETCASCHGRQDPIAPGFRPGDDLLDFFAPELLASVAYTPDGGIVDGDEAFVYGSFSQSRMHAAGVTCVDCHDAHSGETLAEGNALCASCHAPDQFDAPEHHRHEPGTPGAQCVECHMPESTYMGVDRRRDHHIRVPDPVLAGELGVQDACSRCHDGPPPGPLPDSTRPADADFARLIAAARAGDQAAAPGLRQAIADLSLVPFRRASALQLLARFPLQGVEPEATAALADDDALVRAAAAELLGGHNTAAVAPLLADPVRSVRFAALRGLAGRPGVDPRAIAEVLFEWESASLPDVDLPSTWTNQAVLRARLGDRRSAVAALQVALRLDPDFQPALANLAALTGGADRP